MGRDRIRNEADREILRIIRLETKIIDVSSGLVFILFSSCFQVEAGDTFCLLSFSIECITLE